MLILGDVLDGLLVFVMARKQVASENRPQDPESDSDESEAEVRDIERSLDLVRIFPRR